MAKVSRQTINAMELGKYVPSTVPALRVSSIFEVEVSELFSWKIQIGNKQIE